MNHANAVVYCAGLRDDAERKGTESSLRLQENYDVGTDFCGREIGGADAAHHGLEPPRGFQSLTPGRRLRCSAAHRARQTLTNPPLGRLGSGRTCGPPPPK